MGAAKLSYDGSQFRVIHVAEVRKKMVLDLVLQPRAHQPAQPARPKIHRGRRLKQDIIAILLLTAKTSRFRGKMSWSQRREMGFVAGRNNGSDTLITSPTSGQFHNLQFD